MKLIIAGGRSYIPQFRHLNMIATLLNTLRPTEIVSGAAPGADAFGEAIAKALRLPCTQFKANWEAHGKGAGPMRNADMAQYADACILLPGGRGTESIRLMAKRENIPIYDLRNKEYKHD